MAGTVLAKFLRKNVIFHRLVVKYRFKGPSKWVWVKTKTSGDRRYSPHLPGQHFGYPFFDRQIAPKWTRCSRTSTLCFFGSRHPPGHGGLLSKYRPQKFFRIKVTPQIVGEKDTFPVSDLDTAKTSIPETLERAGDHRACLKRSPEPGGRPSNPPTSPPRLPRKKLSPTTPTPPPPYQQRTAQPPTPPPVKTTPDAGLDESNDQRRKGKELG